MNKERIKYIVVHCAATKPNQNIGVKEIDRWHKQRGWAGCGYHFVIRRDGTRETGRKLSKIGAHVRGHNRESIGICLAGGLNKQGKAEENFTKAQYKRLRKLLDELEKQFVNANIIGHRDLDPMKACPCFDVASWYHCNFEDVA